MREIKFRQWQPKTKRFLYIHQMQPGDTVKAEFILHDGELQQYTGLKDKNGKEIYEGDIIYLNDGYEKAIVKFGNYRIIVDFYDHSHGKSVLLYNFVQDHLGFYLDKYYSFDGKLDNLPITYIQLHSSEIKGNIYENPEE